MWRKLLHLHRAITASLSLKSESEKVGMGDEWEARSMGSVSDPYSNLEVKRERARALQDLLYLQTVTDPRLCDATLNVHGKVMKFHWCVLVSCPYFQALFNFNSHINKSSSYELQLHFGNAEAMENSLRFLYTGELSVNQDTVEDYLHIADFLQCSQLTTHCASYLETVRLTTSNCVQIMLMCSMYGLDLYDEAYRYVCGHLPELLTGDHLLDISDASVAAFMSSPTLSFVGRQDFFNFLVRWTERDEEQRKGLFPELFVLLDLRLMQPQFVEDTVSTHPLVTQSTVCQDHVRGAWQWKGRDVCPEGFLMHDVIFLCGGAKNTPHRYITQLESSPSVAAYLVEEARWVVLPNMPYGLRKPIMTVAPDGALVVLESQQFGMFKTRREMLRFCPVTHTWESMFIDWPETEYDVEFHFITYYDKKLYAVASSKCRAPLRRVQPFRGTKRHSQQQQQQQQYHHPAPLVDGVDAPTAVKHHVQLLVMDTTSLKLQPRFTFFQRSVSSVIRVTVSQKRSASSLDGDTLYVMGTKCFDFRDPPTRKSTRSMLLFYDLRARFGKEVFPRRLVSTLNEPMMLGLREGLTCSRLGKINRTLVQQRDKKAVTKNDSDYTLPLPPVAGSRKDFAHLCVDDDVYLFGGSEVTASSYLTSCAKYSFSTKQWTELQDMPVPMSGPGAARGRVSVHHLRCHSDCPHCYFARGGRFGVGGGRWRGGVGEGDEYSDYGDDDYDYDYCLGDRDLDSSYFYDDSDNSPSDLFDYAAEEVLDDWL